MSVESQDIYSGRRIAWRWVWVGVLVVLGMATLLGATLAALGVSTTSFGVFLLVSLIAFLLGGAVIGWLSPGQTPWEAGVASLIAAAWMGFLAMRLLHFGSGFAVTLPVGLALGLGFGLLGGWIGEHIQARGSKA
jgi:hypothetical protein